MERLSIISSGVISSCLFSRINMTEECDPDIMIQIL